MTYIPRFLETTGFADGDFIPAAVGQQLVNDGRTRVYVKNTGFGFQTVTFEAAYACSHGFLDDHAMTVAPGSIGISQPLPADRFGPLVDITYSDPTDLFVVASIGEGYKA